MSTPSEQVGSSETPATENVKELVKKKIEELGGVAAASVASELTESDFIAAEQYDGSKPGYIFKKDKFGVGYYVDKSGELQKRMALLEKKIGVTREAQIAANLEFHAPTVASSLPQGEKVEVKFSEPKWGMTARMSGGPVLITKVKEGGEAEKVGLQIGDELIKINNISVYENRGPALSELRKGGAAECQFIRPPKAAEALAAAGGVMPEVAITTTIDGEHLGEGEMQQLQVMLGNSKGKATVVVGGKTGITETIADGKFDNSATLVFSNCRDCVYTLQNYSMKIYIQDCHNFTLNANSKILTSTMEIFKGTNCTLNIDTEVGTLQADQVEGLNINYKKVSNFTMVVWAGCDPLNVSFADADHKVETGFSKMVQEYKDAELNKDRDQFKISIVDDKLHHERVVRLQNGFTTTMREKNQFEMNQEATLASMAKEMGITIKPGNKGLKVKPNDPCPCGSGKKFKKCTCFSPDGYYKNHDLKKD